MTTILVGFLLVVTIASLVIAWRFARVNRKLIELNIEQLELNRTLAAELEAAVTRRRTAAPPRLRTIEGGAAEHSDSGGSV